MSASGGGSGDCPLLDPPKEEFFIVGSSVRVVPGIYYDVVTGNSSEDRRDSFARSPRVRNDGHPLDM